MKRLFLALGAVLLGAITVGAQAPENALATNAVATNDTLAALQSRLAAQVDDPHFAQAEWGIKVVSLDTGKTLFEHNADKLLKPASNAKLYTTALALDRLGADYRIKTSFYAAAKPDAEGVIHGDVIVYGRGDPSFSSRFNNGDYSKAMQPALEALLAAGIKRIEGSLVADESYFHGPPYGSEWTWDDLQNYYGAPVSALSFQDNEIDLVFKPGAAAGEPCRILTLPETSFMVFSNRSVTAAQKARSSVRLYRPLDQDVTYVWGQVALGAPNVSDAVAVAHPALWFVTALKDALAKRGVTVAGEPRAVNWLNPQPLQTLVEVAAVQSRPLAEIVRQTLKPSENLYAQLLLLQVGAHTASDQSAHDTESAGLSAMRDFLSQAGIDRRMALLEEGSGLSRGCLVTPSSTVKLLTFMNHHRCRQAYIDALPIGGVDGTLRRRFKGTPAAGNVRAKTGSLGCVDTLSGFLTTAAGEKLVFSIMLNAYRATDSHYNGRASIDRLVEQLVAFSQRTEP